MWCVFECTYTCGCASKCTCVCACVYTCVFIVLNLDRNHFINLFKYKYVKNNRKT